MESVEVFDEASLEGENGIKKVLTESYRLAEVESVDCPADQEVTASDTFTCTVRTVVAGSTSSR